MIQPTRTSPDEFVRQGLYGDGTLASYLSDAAAQSPARDAVVEGGVRLSWRELDAHAHRSAAQMRDLGVANGDVVSFLLPNWWEGAVGMQAALKLGAVTNPIVSIYREAELRFILAEAKPSAVVIPHRYRGFDYVEMFVGLLNELPSDARRPAILVVRPEGSLPDGFEAFDSQSDRDPGAIDSPAAASDVCLVLYTSGTTSNPKGVLHTHQTLDYLLRTVRAPYALEPHDSIFMPSPIGHISGYLFGVLMPALIQGTGVLMETWEPDPGRDLVQAERCRFCIGATPFLQGLVDAQGRGDGTISALEVFACGGADVPPALIAGADETLELISGRSYGSSEVPCVTVCATTDSLATRAETDGTPLSKYCEVRVDAPVDGVGELLLRAPMMLVGYLDASLNQDAFTEDGFFRSGDLGEITSSGAVVIRGRKKDVILRGGENVSAKQVEDLLYELPSVREVALVAMPDPVLGERGCAFVVPGEGEAPTLGGLCAHLRDRGLAKQKWPERLELVDALPATASGKIQKFKLREQIRAELEAEAGARDA